MHLALFDVIGQLSEDKLRPDGNRVLFELVLAILKYYSSHLQYISCDIVISPMYLSWLIVILRRLLIISVFFSSNVFASSCFVYSFSSWLVNILRTSLVWVLFIIMWLLYFYFICMGLLMTGSSLDLYMF